MTSNPGAGIGVGVASCVAVGGTGVTVGAAVGAGVHVGSGLGVAAMSALLPGSVKFTETSVSLVTIVLEKLNAFLRASRLYVPGGTFFIR